MTERTPTQEKYSEACLE